MIATRIGLVIYNLTAAKSSAIKVGSLTSWQALSGRKPYAEAGSQVTVISWLTYPVVYLFPMLGFADHADLREDADHADLREDRDSVERGSGLLSEVCRAM